MIVAAAVCPHPPLLARELTGQQDVVADLRGACVSAVRSLLAAAPVTLVVVGGAEDTGSFEPAEPVDFSDFGATALPFAKPPAVPARQRNPLSLRVAQRLLEEAGWTGKVELRSVAWRASTDQAAELGAELAGRTDRIGLLTMGDGGARRGDKAPGYLDERAFDFDERIGRALADGDPQGLLNLEPGLAEELMVGGRAAFQVLAAAAAGSEPRAQMHYQDDPFGVMYFVGVWTLS